MLARITKVAAVMVLTRMQKHIITGRTTAGMPLLQKLNKFSLNSPNKLARANKDKRSSSSPSKVTKPSSPTRNSRTRSPGRSTRKSKLTEVQVDQLSAAIPLLKLDKTTAQGREETDPASKQDVLESNFFPSVIIGEHETVGLSIIGRAEKEIRMWEQVLADHQRELPSLAPVVEQKLREAKENRASIDESLEENWRVGDPDPAATAIKARLQALQWALDTSKFGPEAENIRCVMEGYKSGDITYSTNYTLIWAGKIVDTASHYRDFTADRSDRLDRYFERYGPGWFFYEEPLKVHPSLKPKLCASVALIRTDALNPLQLFHITQGFWKRANFVSRMPILARSSMGIPTPEDPLYARNENGEVYCGDRGPKLAFRSLLDSGSTFPTLHFEDLYRLGIDPLHYGAQCIQTMQTATGQTTSRIFELWVAVLNDDGQQLVNSNDPVYPYSHMFLGGLCPVAQSSMPMQYDANGIEIPFRLSGIMPFVACYLSSTPGQNILFLGEDRNDVLGSHRMPGQKKWTIEMPPINQPELSPDRYGNPHITFRHRQDRIVDMDRMDKRHASTITFLGGTPGEQIVESDPAEAQRNAMLWRNIEAEIAEYQGPGQNLQVEPPL